MPWVGLQSVNVAFLGHAPLFLNIHYNSKYSKACVKRPLSKLPKIGFQDQLSLNVGQKYCRMLQGKHSAILSTFIKLPFVIKIFVSSIFEWPFNTCFTVQMYLFRLSLDNYKLHTMGCVIYIIIIYVTCF